MLEKMKKRFKNEKGFTLVELLAVVAILAIILAIAIPSVGGLINDSKDEAHETNMKLFENAARLAYVSGLEPTNSGYALTSLEEKGYLEEIPKNPLTDEQYGGYVNFNQEDGTDFRYEGRSETENVGASN